MQHIHIVAAILFITVYADESCTSPRESGSKCSTATPKMQFYYDSHTGVCQPFMYFGCQGNDNRFKTRDECSKKCMHNEEPAVKGMTNGVVEACALTTDAKISDEAKGCSIDGDCEKDWKCTRNFCCPTKKHLCHLPANQGTQINGKISKAERFAWLQGVNNCLPFSYFGIDGNFNNFATYDACIATCKP